MVSLDVVALAVVPAVLWGFSPVLSKRWMAGGGTSLQASLIVVIVDSVVFWTGLVAVVGLGSLTTIEPWAIGVFAIAGFVGTALGRWPRLRASTASMRASTVPGSAPGRCSRRSSRSCDSANP